MTPYTLRALADDPLESNWMWRTCGKTSNFWLLLVRYKMLKGLLGI